MRRLRRTIPICVGDTNLLKALFICSYRLSASSAKETALHEPSFLFKRPTLHVGKTSIRRNGKREMKTGKTDLSVDAIELLILAQRNLQPRGERIEGI